MALIGIALSSLTPALPTMATAVAHAQRTADGAGADSLVLAAGGLLAWAVWMWGAAGLALAALSTLPGLVGLAARVLLHVVFPAGARHGAALLLGLGLGVAAPVVTMTALVPTVAAAAPVGSSSAPAGVPDWPLAAPTSGGSVPDWPAPATAGVDKHVVLRGECLWQIAADHLRQRPGSPPSDAAIARAVRAWWSANADVIGPNPDLLLPGQVLQPPP
jgi:hypothetical protein